jgi:hypothetical protein
MIKLMRMGLVGHLAQIGKEEYIYRVFGGKAGRKETTRKT